MDNHVNHLRVRLHYSNKEALNQSSLNMIDTVTTREGILYGKSEVLHPIDTGYAVCPNRNPIFDFVSYNMLPADKNPQYIAQNTANDTGHKVPGPIAQGTCLVS